MAAVTVPHLAPVEKHQGRPAYYATWYRPDVDVPGQAVCDEVGAWWFLADDGRMFLLHAATLCLDLPRIVGIVLHGHVGLVNAYAHHEAGLTLPLAA